MIEIKIGEVDIETILEALADNIDKIQGQNTALDKVNALQQSQIDSQREQLANLQSQLIEMQNEGAKERNSFWDFLKGNKKPKETSRIKETTVQLDK